ncbi:MAG: hypothetical protein IPH57_14640 [Saprospiraceae bacterium]|nr:hypothetical protein [Saprospiraceae bacterium]
MKNILLILLGLVFISWGCGKDEPSKSIDQFVGTATGNYYDYKCSDTLIILNTKSNSVAKIEKQDDTNLTGTLTDGTGKSIYSFKGVLNSVTSDTFYITNFVLNSLTYTGQGIKKNGKLNIIFGNSGCKVGANSYRITSEFKQN